MTLKSEFSPSKLQTDVKCVIKHKKAVKLFCVLIWDLPDRWRSQSDTCLTSV